MSQASWNYDPVHSHWTYTDPPRDEGRKGQTEIDYSHDIRPYLQLPHLFSLTWLAYPIISLIFIVFRLQISSDSANDAVANVKADLLASCKAAEHAATSAASMPRYLAAATNAQITDAVNGTLNAARATMTLALTVMEAIINFVIDIYRSTLLCFIELVVRGALSILLGAVDEINKFLQSTFSGLKTSIQNDVNGLNSAIKTVVDAANNVPFFHFTPPQISTPSLSALDNVQLPSDFTSALQNLNNSLPTIADLKNKIEDIVDSPFELLKKDINDTFASLHFDVSALPLPSQNTVTFCNQMDTSVVDDLGHDLVKMVKIGTAILIVLIFLLIAANCWLEWYKWRAMKDHFRRIKDDLRRDPGVTTLEVGNELYARASNHDLMSIEGTMAHPWVTKFILFFQSWMNPRRRDKIIWFAHYVFHPPALACFLIGVFGLLSVELQLLAIGPIQHKYEQQASASVSDFSNLIATSVNASMYNDSATYAGQVNARVDAVQSTINDGLFGWVNSTTTTLNETVNTFYSDVQNLVNTVFGNTILNDPVQEFVRCFIGSKVDAIENALTFLHDNLHVDIPRVNDTVLVLSPQSVNEATQPIAQAAIGTGNDNNDGLVGRVVSVYVRSLEKERVMFSIFMGLWGLVVLMAFAFLLWETYGPYRNKAPSRAFYSPSPAKGDDARALDDLVVVPLDDEKTASRPARPGVWQSARGFLNRGRKDHKQDVDAYPYPMPPEYFANEKYGTRGADEEQALPPPVTDSKHSRFKLMFARKRDQSALPTEPEHVAEDHNPFSDKHPMAGDDPFEDRHSVQEHGSGQGQYETPVSPYAGDQAGYGRYPSFPRD
ncbi:hypothetical protein OH76DRAFT_1441099 [Lentinus brumalis]|uniref:Plasma membrane fusion protein PRM1 n=1 Tax=Lentinus brumalis TaxID=2498619 RepID=A0A371D5S6_9APHY|nr:hypothetical protein OH76DRAFT_1441099 [Polyporus brumalis]